jgi:hypothetical protein
MIKKIIKIKNVGKFQNYAPKAETLLSYIYGKTVEMVA